MPLLAMLLGVVATTVMSYVAMATPIGPWMAPTLAVCAIAFCWLFRVTAHPSVLIPATVSGSIGGIVATGVAFSFPALAFIDPEQFTRWLDTPLVLCGLLASIVCAAGSVGLWCAYACADHLLREQNLSFPIGKLTYDIVAAPGSKGSVRMLSIGAALATIFGMLRDGLFGFRSLFARSLTLFSGYTWHTLRVPPVHVDMWPVLWAIGFIGGPAIALPLGLGACARIVLVDPINALLYSSVPPITFTFAWCTGMVIVGPLIGVARLGWSVVCKTDSFCVSALTEGLVKIRVVCAQRLTHTIFTMVAVIGLLSFLQFSLGLQIYVLLTTLICAYYVAGIAGRAGIAPLGRFATYVMLPAMIFFRVDAVQAVFIALFVEVAVGVTADALFGMRAGELAAVCQERVRRYQYVGLLVSTLTVGGVFLLLIQSMPLGSEQLFAYKAQNRYLLINALSGTAHLFMPGVCMGGIFALLLQHCGIGPTLVLGGLLMDVGLTLGLIIGALCAYCTHNRARWEHFWSGVFAADSLWMIVRALIG